MLYSDYLREEETQEQDQAFSLAQSKRLWEITKIQRENEEKWRKYEEWCEKN